MPLNPINLAENFSAGCLLSCFKFSLPSVSARASSITYSAFRRLSPTDCKSSKFKPARASASCYPFFWRRCHRTLATRRDICCPKIILTSDGKVAGSKRSGGLPYVFLALAKSSSSLSRQLKALKNSGWLVSLFLTMIIYLTSLLLQP